MGEEWAAERKELESDIAKLKKTIEEENNVHDLRNTLDTLNQQLQIQVAELNKLREAAVVNPIVTEPTAVVNIQDAMKELTKIVHALSTQCQKKLNSELRKGSADEVKRAQSANQTPRKQRPTSAPPTERPTSAPPTERPQPIPEEETTTTKNNHAVERAKKAKENANQTPLRLRPTSAPPAEWRQPIQEEKTTTTVPPGETGRLRPRAEGKARRSEGTSRKSRGAFNALRRTQTEPENPR
eukprot:6491251-Prymnesium_polylepis.1